MSEEVYHLYRCTRCDYLFGHMTTHLTWFESLFMSHQLRCPQCGTVNYNPTCYG